MHAMSICRLIDSARNRKSIAKLLRSAAFIAGLAVFSPGTALAVPVCASSDFCTGTELAAGASFSENGFTFSNFYFSPGFGALEFLFLPGSHVGTGATQRWANSGFYVTGAGGGNFIEQAFPPESNFEFLFNYRVTAPVDADFAVVFDRALLSTIGVAYSGRNAALVSASEEISGLRAINLDDLLGGPPGASGTAQLGQFNRVGLDISNVIRGIVLPDSGNSTFELRSLVNTFDAKTVPEPGTLALLGIAALGLLGIRRLNWVRSL